MLGGEEEQDLLIEGGRASRSKKHLTTRNV